MVDWIQITSSLPRNLPLGESLFNLNLGGFIPMHVYIVVIVSLDFYLLKIFVMVTAATILSFKEQPFSLWVK